MFTHTEKLTREISEAYHINKKTCVSELSLIMHEKKISFLDDKGSKLVCLFITEVTEQSEY